MIELYIEGQPADISKDFSTLLTFQLDDVRNFGSRNTNFSKTIILPGTSRNNKLLGHVYDVKSANYHDPALDNINYNFNAAKSARCLIFEDNIQCFKGVIRLLDIVKDGEVVEYEMATFGELGGFVSSLSNKRLEDLDFSDYDHNFNETNIVNSWNTINGVGYYYPLIDYGGFSITAGASYKHDWDIRTFRPALYAKEYIDRIFEGVNYSYACALFETARFKSIIIPFNQKTLTTLNTRLLSASRSTDASLVNSGTATTVSIPYATVVTTIFTASLSNSRFTYNGSAPTTVKINLQVVGTYKGSATSFTVEVRKNGVLIPGQTYTLATTGTSTSIPWSWSPSEFDVSVTTSDYLEVTITASGVIIGSDECRVSISNLYADAYTATSVPVAYNDSFSINQSIPRNVLQKDFFTSFLKLFNLYVYEDQYRERFLNIAPYPDFFDTDPANALDWSYKLNRDKPVRLKPMSQLTARYYEFKFKSDSDYYNDAYRKKYGVGYGDRIYDSEFEFAQDKESVEVIFSATPLLGWTGEEKVWPSIMKITNGTEESVESNIRIMLAKKITGVASWNIKDSSTVLTSTTSYGYAGHFDDPDSPTNDLNFGATSELYFDLASGYISANQFNVYWSPYMAEVTDKDSKMLVGSFILKTSDIFNLDFSKLIYLDGALWRLNKIEDYNASYPDECKVELLRVLNTVY